MYKYLFCLMFLLPACGSLYQEKFDAAVMANASTIQEYVPVSEAFAYFISLAIEQNPDNTQALKILNKWKSELNKSNRNVALVAMKLSEMVAESNWPDDIKQAMFTLCVQIAQKWMGNKQ